MIGFQPATGAVRRLPYLGGDPRGLLHPQVHAVLVARDHRIWIGTGHGLAVFDPASNRLTHFGKDTPGHPGLSGSLVRALWQDPRGDVWVGSHSGLDRAHADRNGDVAFSRPLQPLLEGDPAPVVYSIAGDAAGDLWLGTNRGLMRYSPAPAAMQGAAGGAPGHLRQYGLADGLQDLEFNGGAATVLRDGRLAFGGINGTNTFAPARIQDSSAQPPLRLLAARLGGGMQGSAADPWTGGKIEMPESASLLRLRIGALDYLGSAAIRYRYRLDGIDPDWIDNGARGDISYTLLPAGRYLFRAQSTNHEGVWGAEELRLPIVVTPPAWRSPPALVAYALLAAAGLWLLWVLRGRRRRHEREVFERIRDREQRLKLALWASGEQFWDYDLRTGAMQRMRVDDEDIRSADDIHVETEIQSRHRVHDDDLTQVRGKVRQHLRGGSATFESEHRIPADAANGCGSVPAAGWSNATAPAARGGWPAPPATSPSSAMPNASAGWPGGAAQHERGGLGHRPGLQLHLGQPRLLPDDRLQRGRGMGRSAGLLDSSQHEPEFYRAMRRELERTGHWAGEMWQRRKDGEEFLGGSRSAR